MPLKVCGTVIEVQEKHDKNEKKYVSLKMEYPQSGEGEECVMERKTIQVLSECKNFHQAMKVNMDLLIPPELQQMYGHNLLPNLVIFDFVKKEMQRLKEIETKDYSTYLSTFLLGKYMECEVEEKNGYAHMKRVLKITN